MMGSVWHLIGHLNRTEPCQAIVLFFPQSYGVRHRFINKIKNFDCMMHSPEKHRRACKRGALPTELQPLVLVIHILLCR